MSEELQDGFVDRRQGQRRSGSWLYWMIGILVIVCALVIFVPAINCPKIVRYGLVALLAALCLFDRRGLTPKKLGGLMVICAAVCGLMLFFAWHTPQMMMWAAATALLLIFGLALFSTNRDPRVR